MGKPSPPAPLPLHRRPPTPDSRLPTPDRRLSTADYRLPTVAPWWPAAGPTNVDCPGAYWTNILFHFDEFRHLRPAPGAGLLRRVESCRSEDALVWNVFRGLAGRVEPMAVELWPEPGRSIPFGLSGSVLCLWNRPVAGGRRAGDLLAKLRTVLYQIESSSVHQSEFDAVLYDPARRQIAIVEAKLTAPLGNCPAVHGRSPDCRLSRTLPDPRHNGCSYWGRGTGGDAFAERFPRQLVGEYLTFGLPSPERPAGADCDRHYQLMRCWLAGQELAKQLGEGHSFALVVAGCEGYLDRAALDDFAARIRPGPGRLGVLTWQSLRDALPAGEPVHDYLRCHSIVTPVGHLVQTAD
ncbi:MAG: hypothetical protein HY331_17100 [Chloroflexi bacterium]|nr:hypothetical protein [Chloroflexota bacterium]